MNTWKGYTITALSALMLGITVSSQASPIFSIGDGMPVSWDEAINAGNVVPVTSGELTGAAQQFYDDQVGAGNYALAPTQLSIAPVSDGNINPESLVMTWDHPAGDLLGVASWDYVYDVDPDLRGTYLHFSIFAPVGVWDISLELIDIAGNSRGWFLSNPLHDVWQKFWLKAGLVGDQQGFRFFETPGFDITQVVAVRLNESGISSMPFVLPPPGSAISGIPWNAWNHLKVTIPVPGSLYLLLAGLGATLLAGRRRPTAGE